MENNLQQLSKVLNFVEEKLETFTFKNDKASTNAAAILFIISIDHAQGISFLLKEKAYPSAFALLRSVFETYIRGMWISNCANDFQVAQFIERDRLLTKVKKNLTFNDMVSEVETVYRLPEWFSKIKKQVWSGLNSLTHSGSIQLHKNFDGKTIRHCYDDKHVNEAIDFTTFVLCMAFGALMNLTTSTTENETIEELWGMVRPWIFDKTLQPIHR